MQSIHSRIDEFCEPYFLDKDAIFSAESLTRAFIAARLEREWPKAPEDMQQAVYIGIQQLVRARCRHAHNDDDKDLQLQLNLPEAEFLQERYSVPRGHGFFEYVPRHLLTEWDVTAICKRDRKISEWYARRADVLESWFYRKKTRYVSA